MTALDHAHIEASAKAAVLARMTAGSLRKAQGGATVAAAVQAARAAEDRPAAFWRRALQQLGETLLSDGTLVEQTAMGWHQTVLGDTAAG